MDKGTNESTLDRLRTISRQRRTGGVYDRMGDWKNWWGQTPEERLNEPGSKWRRRSPPPSIQFSSEDEDFLRSQDKFPFASCYTWDQGLNIKIPLVRALIENKVISFDEGLSLPESARNALTDEATYQRIVNKTLNVTFAGMPFMQDYVNEGLIDLKEAQEIVLNKYNSAKKNKLAKLETAILSGLISRKAALTLLEIIPIFDTSCALLSNLDIVAAIVDETKATLSLGKREQDLFNVITEHKPHLARYVERKLLSQMQALELNHYQENILKNDRVWELLLDGSITFEEAFTLRHPIRLENPAVRRLVRNKKLFLADLNNRSIFSGSSGIPFSYDDPALYPDEEKRVLSVKNLIEAGFLTFKAALVYHKDLANPEIQHAIIAGDKNILEVVDKLFLQRYIDQGLITQTEALELELTEDAAKILQEDPVYQAICDKAISIPQAINSYYRQRQALSDPEIIKQLTRGLIQFSDLKCADAPQQLVPPGWSSYELKQKVSKFEK